MESESSELPSSDDAAAALAETAADRRVLVGEVTRTGVWYYPAFATLAALVVWAPAIGSVSRFTMLVALCTVGFTSLESLRERRSGVSMSRPTSRRGVTILIAIGVVFVALIATSLVLVIANHSAFALLCASVTFAVMFVAAWLYDESFRLEVTRAR